MSELTDALIQLLGRKEGLMVVILVLMDTVQTRYLSQRIATVDEQVGAVRSRVRRVEGQHMETDGGGEEP